MAKNLKVNVKNAQLAEALNLVKPKLKAPRKAVKEPEAVTAPDPIESLEVEGVEQTSRRSPLEGTIISSTAHEEAVVTKPQESRIEERSPSDQEPERVSTTIPSAPSIEATPVAPRPPARKAPESRGSDGPARGAPNINGRGGDPRGAAGPRAPVEPKKLYPGFGTPMAAPTGPVFKASASTFQYAAARRPPEAPPEPQRDSRDSLDGADGLPARRSERPYDRDAAPRGPRPAGGPSGASRPMGPRPPYDRGAAPGARPPYGDRQGTGRPPYTPGAPGATARPGYDRGPRPAGDNRPMTSRQFGRAVAPGARPSGVGRPMGPPGSRGPGGPPRGPGTGPRGPGMGGAGRGAPMILPPGKETPSRFGERKDAPRRPDANRERDARRVKGQGDGRFDARDRQGLRDTDDEGWRKRRGVKGRQEMADLRPETDVTVRLPISVKDLAAAMKLKVGQVISKLFMQGLTFTVNDLLDDETLIQLVGSEFHCTVHVDRSEEDRVAVTKQSIRTEIQTCTPEQLIMRAPVVTFMGHVDHGKTSLIDAIRSSNRAAQEAGAITQHIGAFQVTTGFGAITILDTPGHEAFDAMRARGADVTDVVVLVVAGDEGMRQQTLEALNQARAAKVQILVAINKADRPGYNVEQVYRQLADQDLLPEAWGGQTICVQTSAVTKQGIDQLLEMVALQTEVMELHACPGMRARGTVLEAEMHKGLGATATVLVQNGTLRLGDSLVFSNCWARVKTMKNHLGQNMKEAGPSVPVMVTGLSDLPEAGSEFIVVKNEREAREISTARLEGLRHAAQQTKRPSMDSLLEATEKKTLRLIIKADVKGSLEALLNALGRIKSEKVSIEIVSQGVGEISESDVILAATSKAFIFGFHTVIEAHAAEFVRERGVSVKLHDIIYHLVDDVRDQMRNLLDKLQREAELGIAEVRQTFKSSALGIIAGCQVVQGLVRRNSLVRQIRNGEVIWKGSISGLKKVKEDVREVLKGFDCGILLSGTSDIQEGDLLQAYEIEFISQDL
ncbi:MAG: translation initiation factor IF-2 [Chlamydiia bacterium]